MHCDWEQCLSTRTGVGNGITTQGTVRLEDRPVRLESPVGSLGQLEKRLQVLEVEYRVHPDTSTVSSTQTTGHKVAYDVRGTPLALR